jgi:hypothetical protein
MIADVTGAIDPEVISCQERFRAIAECWLALAAAPTFAIMALLIRIHGGGMPGMLCSAARDASPLSGMDLMYLLMSGFHLAPWLTLLFHRSHSRALRQRAHIMRHQGAASMLSPSQKASFPPCRTMPPSA